MDIAGEFLGIPTGNICDMMDNREGAMDEAMKPLHHSFRLAGRALTVECFPGDNLTIHKAITVAKPGDVLVIDCKGYMKAGVFGEIFASSCRKRGIAGAVINGCCRDKHDLIEMNFPVFALGVNPNGTVKERLGKINEPVLICGRMVRACDIIVGDADGVIVIPSENAEEILKKSTVKKEKEAEWLRLIEEKNLTTADLLNLYEKF
ncbi:MAG: RraA family protein [Clostridia bacterium]|nr:RraA family protein [Clostridia bacterium]